jgi:hypothetical protein
MNLKDDEERTIGQHHVVLDNLLLGDRLAAYACPAKREGRLANHWMGVVETLGPDALKKP